MQTIKITITSEKPANVVLTERKPEEDKAKKKKSSFSKLEALLGIKPKEVIHAGESKEDEPPCD